MFGLMFWPAIFPILLCFRVEINVQIMNTMLRVGKIKQKKMNTQVQMHAHLYPFFLGEFIIT